MSARSPQAARATGEARQVGLPPDRAETPPRPALLWHVTGDIYAPRRCSHRVITEAGDFLLIAALCTRKVPDPATPWEPDDEHKFAAPVSTSRPAARVTTGTRASRPSRLAFLDPPGRSLHATTRRP